MLKKRTHEGLFANYVYLNAGTYMQYSTLSIFDNLGFKLLYICNWLEGNIIPCNNVALLNAFLKEWVGMTFK